MAVRILFVDHATGLGGAEHSLILLLQNMDESAWFPHVATVEGPLLDKLIDLDIPVFAVPLPRMRRSSRAPLDWARGTRAIVRLANQTGASLLVANTVRAAVYAALAARLSRCPFVWYMRDFWLSENEPANLHFDRCAKRLILSQAARVIANSRAVAEHLPASPKVVVIHNGIDLRCFDPGRSGEAFRRAHAIPTGAPVVGMVGRLRPWKGQKRFLQVAQMVLQEVSEAHFVLVGGSPFGVADGYAEQLHRIVTQMGIQDRVTFAGQLDDVSGALAAFDVFVHPGDPEPFGRVNLEAMAMEKPVVAFAHGALPEIIVNREAGLLVPPNDIELMSRAVTELLRDPERRNRLGRAGRERVEQVFTASRVARDVEAVLREVVDDGRRTA